MVLPMSTLRRHSAPCELVSRWAALAMILGMALNTAPQAVAETLSSNALGIQMQTPDGTQVTGKNAPNQAPFLLMRGGGDTPR